MSNKLIENNENQPDIYTLRNYYLLLFLVVVSVVSLGLGVANLVFIKTLENKMKPAETQITSIESSVPDVEVSSETPETASTGIQMGDMYTGAFAVELAGVGLVPYEVTNTADYMGTDFNGKIYTEELNQYMSADMPTSITVKNTAVDIQTEDAFSAVDGLKKGSDETGTFYYLSDSDEEGAEKYLFVRNLNSKIPSDQGEKSYSVGYISVSDYEKSKSLGIKMVGDFTVDATIQDFVNTYGKPTYLDIYEMENEPAYLMLYYSKMNENDGTVDEMSVIFVCDETAKNGYYLSESTVSVFEKQQ